jgi:uncharacterized protein involved in outer membrane biogenesis
VRKTAIVLAILMFAALAGLLLAPQFVDVDRYRPLIAEKFSEWSGRSVTLGGPISLSLLPSPHVSVHDLVVANIPGAQAGDMVRVREVDAAVSFWPLLAGQIEVTSAQLLQPVIALERLPDGRANWTFGGTALSASTVIAGDGGRGAVSLPSSAANLKIGGLTIKVASLAVEDALVSYRSGDTLETAEHIGLKLTGDTVSAPLHAEGRFTAFGATFGVVADVGRVGRAQVPLSLTLTAEPATSAEFAGELLLEPQQPRFRGKFTLKGEDLGTVARLAGFQPVPPMLSKPVRLAGDFEAAADRASLDRFALELGDMRGSGTLRLGGGAPPAIDLQLAVNSFDVDRFLAERAANSTAGQGRTAQVNAAATAPKAPIIAAAGRWGLPPDIAATVDLAIDSVSWRQGVLRQARLEAALNGGKVQVKRFVAVMPGGTDISLAGSIDALAAAPHFTGTVKANADNLRDLLRWGGVALEGVPADRLRRATVQSQLEVDDTIMEVRSLDLTFDASHLTGAATIAMRDRLALGARLAIDQLNLDAYLSGDPTAQTGLGSPGSDVPAAPSAPGSMTRVTVTEALASALISFDANIDASAETLIWRNQPIRKVRVTGTLQNRDLTLRELSVNDLGGAQGKLSGYIQGIGAAQPKTQFAFDMRGPELGRVLRLLSSSVASADTFGAFSLGGEVERQVGQFNLDTDVEVGGGKLHVVGDAPGVDTWALTASLEHPSFNRLMRLATPRYRPLGELGPVKFNGKMEWSPTSAVMRNFTLDIGGLSVGGDLEIALASRPMLRAKLSLNDLAIDKFMPVRQTATLDEPVPRLKPGVMLAQAGSSAPRGGAERWSKSPIELDFLRPFDAEVTLVGKGLSWASWRIDDPQVKLALKDSVLGITHLSGRLFGGALAATGSIDASETPRLRLAAQLAGADFKQALGPAGVSRLEGGFDLDASLATTGANTHELVSHLDGTVSLRSRDGTIDGINIPAVNQRLAQVKGLGDLATLLRAATAGSTHFSKLDGSFKLTDGVARSEDLHLVAEGGDGAGTATVDLPNWTVVNRTEVRMMGVPGTPPLGVTLKGPLEQPDWSLDFSAIARAFGARAVERFMGPERGGPGQPEPAQGDPGKSPKAKDLLRNLLKTPQ